METKVRMDPRKSEEFEQFLKTNDLVPNSEISQNILSAVYLDLYPSPTKVFSKLLGIHCLSTLVTLSLCPQFGIRVLGEGPGLMGVFMNLGKYGCMVACGSFFTGFSLLVACLVLRFEELQVIQAHRWVQLGSLTVLSLGFFMMLDANLFFGIAAAWLLGSFLGSYFTLELGRKLRKLALPRI